ncbi:unnamed protein product [Heterosigma akashiwo]
MQLASMETKAGEDQEVLDDALDIADVGPNDEFDDEDMWEGWGDQTSPPPLPKIEAKNDGPRTEPLPSPKPLVGISEKHIHSWCCGRARRRWRR